MGSLVANIQGEGVVIPSPGPGKAIAIVGISTNAPCELRENDADGYLIAYIPQGSTNLTACINAGLDLAGDGEGNACFVGVPGGSPEEKAALLVSVAWVIFPLRFVPKCRYNELYDLAGPADNSGLLPSIMAKQCGSDDCVAKSFSGRAWLRGLGTSKRRLKGFISLVYGNDPNFKGFCAGGGFLGTDQDCEDFAWDEYCVIMWCYYTAPRWRNGFNAVLWGYTLCYGPPLSGSPCSGYEEYYPEEYYPDGNKCFISDIGGNCGYHGFNCEMGEKGGPYFKAHLEDAIYDANANGYSVECDGLNCDEGCYHIYCDSTAYPIEFYWQGCQCGPISSSSSGPSSSSSTGQSSSSSAGQSSSSSAGQSSSSSAGQSSSSSSSSSSGAGPTPSGY